MKAFYLFALHGGHNSTLLCVCHLPPHLPRPVKSPLKVQNGVQEVDSPVKKVAKRSRQILDSDDDEEAPVVKEPVATKGQGDKEAANKKEKVERAAVHFSLIKTSESI